MAQFISGSQRPPSSLSHALTAVLSRLANISNPKPWIAYIVAVIVTALAAAERWVLGTLLGPELTPYITFYPMIMLAALFGGVGPGLLATALAAMAVSYLFLPPIGSFAVFHPAHKVDLALFIAINIAVSFVCGALRAARRRTLAEARRAQGSEERFRLFMDHTPTLACVKDAEGRYTYINKAYEQRFGHTIDECRGKTDADLWPANVAARLQKADLAALAADHPTETTEEVTESNGTVSFWLNTKFPFRDGAGRRFIANLGLDITEAKRAEAALAENEARLRLAIETAELGMYERDLITNKVALNTACQAILGVTEPFAPDLAQPSRPPRADPKFAIEAGDRG